MRSSSSNATVFVKVCERYRNIELMLRVSQAIGGYAINEFTGIVNYAWFKTKRSKQNLESVIGN